MTEYEKRTADHVIRVNDRESAAMRFGAEFEQWPLDSKDPEVGQRVFLFSKDLDFTQHEILRVEDRRVWVGQAIPWEAHNCTTFEKTSHPANTLDWSSPGTRQGYQVYQCTECGAYWGCRHQWDAGTGSDDRWHKFGYNPAEIRRHY